MGLEQLSSRAIIGMYYEELDAATAADWADDISNLFSSDQDSETYDWIGMAPALREWIGGRNAVGFAVSGVSITNKHFEGTVEVKVKDARRDKTGQLRVRVGNLADRAVEHWAELLSTLLINAETTVCYDGQYFFDTDHSEGASGTQSNSISVDIDVDPPTPADYEGTTTNPGPLVFAYAIGKAIEKIIAQKDDKGQPMNANAKAFTVMVPVAYMGTANAAINAMTGPHGGENPLQTLKKQGFTITLKVNPRLTWTTKFAVLRTDGRVKPLIRQQETPPMMKAKAEGSEYEFDNDAWQFGVDTWRNVGYGLWQHACLVTFV